MTFGLQSWVTPRQRANGPVRLVRSVLLCVLRFQLTMPTIPWDGEGKAGSSGSDPFPNVALSRDFGTLRPCFFPVLLPVYGNRVLRNLLCRASPSRPFFRRHVVWDLLQGRTLEGSRLWRTAPVKTLVGRHTYNRGIGLSSCNQAPDARCRTCEMRVNTRRSSTD